MSLLALKLIQTVEEVLTKGAAVTISGFFNLFKFIASNLFNFIYFPKSTLVDCINYITRRNITFKPI